MEQGCLLNKARLTRHLCLDFYQTTMFGCLPVSLRIPLNHRPLRPQLGLRTWGLCYVMWPHDETGPFECISELSGWLRCVNGTIGLMGASCCHGSAEKRNYRDGFGAAALIMTPALLPLQLLAQLLSLSLSVCECVGVLHAWFISFLLQLDVCRWDPLD